MRLSRLKTKGIGRVLYVVSIAVILLPVLFGAESRAQEPILVSSAAGDLTQMSIEDLLNVEVTSVSKRAQRLSDTSAAVFVITAEDIRRTGATSIPEALRMVPGMHVARIDNNKWAISCRGFTDRFANKLLVLMDGRSLYSPMFSGTFWDVQDTMMEDIERIEVIRGPGATMWGANAVNGVINIITKTASQTTNKLFATGVDADGQSATRFRYGDSAGTKGNFRVYAKRFGQAASYDPGGQYVYDPDLLKPGEHAFDQWEQSRGGFRMDMDVSSTTALTVQGDVYNGDGGQRIRDVTYSAPFQSIVNDNVHVSGGNLMAKWHRTLSPTSDSAIRFYYDRTYRLDGQINEKRNTYDLEYQHNFGKGQRHEVVWGVGYRQSEDYNAPTKAAVFRHPHNTDHLLSGFIQDQIALSSSKARLTVGSKFERNDYSGFEIQPSLRLSYDPGKRQTLWASVSRAIRTPSRGETDADVTLKVLQGSPQTMGLPVAVVFMASPDLKPEQLIAYELGYRMQPSDSVSVDIAAFVNDYRDLRTVEPGAIIQQLSHNPPHLVQPMYWRNLSSAKVVGIEVSSNYRISPSWSIMASYSRHHMNQFLDPTSMDTNTSYDVTLAREQFQLRSYLDLPNGLELDAMLYYVDPVNGHGVPKYTRLDMRLGWRRTHALALSIEGQNLLDSHHAEFGGTISEMPMEIERTVFARATYQF